jgi:hypothetical protein
VVDGKSLSLELVVTFDKFGRGEGSNTLEAFVKEKMLGEEPLFEELIIVGHALGVEVAYSHSSTFVALV